MSQLYGNDTAAKSGENQAQASTSPFLVKSQRTPWVPTAELWQTTRVKYLPGKLSTQGSWGRRGLIKFQTSRLQKESRCWTQTTLFVQFRPHQPLVSFREWWELYSLQSPQSCPTLCDPVDCIACQAPLSTGFPGKNIRVGCHARLQGIFLTQGSNLRLLHWQAGFFTTSTTWEALQKWYLCTKELTVSGLRPLSLESPICKVGPSWCIGTWISGEFPPFPKWYKWLVGPKLYKQCDLGPTPAFLLESGSLKLDQPPPAPGTLGTELSW